MEYSAPAEANRRKSFELLYDEYYDKVYIYIFRRVNHQQTAEDLTADVFMNAFARPYDPKLAKFSTYIFTIASNILKNHYRSASKNSLLAGEEELGKAMLGDMDIPDALIAREASARLKLALAQLPERQYMLLFRRYYLEQSFKEIGGALSVTESYARKIHERALASLKKIYLLGVTFQEPACIHNQMAEGGDD